ncbi:hypothetical protein BN946_scf184940.g79 [Trametes cinnabarina]|uniref:Uncharacterized protein n=1 Tax=Pycnoporus cinnabarinus TaxID=5643 RepID=A0A060SBQ5_PYCCI|nr:hypothetical protein BN946_scf184940.g79 [Trametes cinnabarina]
MAVSSHRIHTIHGAFGAPSCFGASDPPLAINPSQASSWSRIPNVCAPRSRPFRAASGATSPGPPPSRASSALASASASVSAPPSIMDSSSGSRPRRSSLSFSGPAPSRRAPPPPPAPVERTASALRSTTAPVVDIPRIDDPFADAHEEEDVPLTPLPLPPSSRTRVSTYTVPVSGSGSRSMSSSLASPPGLPSSFSTISSAKDMRGRLVASVLLNRGSGRPLGAYLRRRLSGQEHTYVKSGLSRVVAAAA